MSLLTKCSTNLMHHIQTYPEKSGLQIAWKMMEKANLLTPHPNNPVINIAKTTARVALLAFVAPWILKGCIAYNIIVGVININHSSKVSRYFFMGILDYCILGALGSIPIFFITMYIIAAFPEKLNTMSTWIVEHIPQ